VSDKMLIIINEDNSRGNLAKAKWAVYIAQFQVHIHTKNLMERYNILALNYI